MSTAAPEITIRAPFPPKLAGLFAPHRYKVCWGGRGAGRSWGFARAILIKGSKSPLRVLCVRELQNSIADSVHAVLSDQIEKLGLAHFYRIEQARIYGANGTEISFEGIKNNSTKVKSYEGIDICWVEEANKVSKASWSILTPTIRKDGSEIWVSFNPELDTDYTYRRFVLDPEPDSWVQHMNFHDNPWFPKALNADMEKCKERDYDEYLNVWEGHPLVILDGVIYAKQLRRAIEEKRITNVPWDREAAVDTFWDLGRADQTAIWFAQVTGGRFNILHYYQNHGEDIDHYIKYCQNLEYVYGVHHLPHDAKAKKLGSKRTIQEAVQRMGQQVTIVPKLSLSDGINAARMIFSRCWFDAKECEDGLTSLKHYRYNVVDGQLSNEPRHDEFSDGADAFRYLGVMLRPPKGKSTLLQKLDGQTEERRSGLRLGPINISLGWMQ